jgi:hypothetical protein
LRAPYYYSRWYNCVNPSCETTLIMPPEFRIDREHREIWGDTDQDALAEPRKM